MPTVAGKAEETNLQQIRIEILQQTVVIVYGLELGTMRIEEVGRKTHRRSLLAAIDIERLHLGGVDRHEHIGHNSAVGNVHAVNRYHLPALVAVIDIVHIVVGVRFLDAAARRSIVPGHRKAYARTVGKIDGLLNQTLSEGTAPHQGGPAVILHCTGKDLTRRSGAVRHQERKTYVAQYALAVCAVLVPVAVDALHVNDKFTLIQEHIAEQQRLIEEAAAIVTQIDYQVLHALVLKLKRSLGELLGRSH